MDTTFIKDFTVTTDENSAVKIEGEVPFAEVAKQREAALKELGKDVELDGFRKGHVPEKVLVEHIGEGRLLTEMAERTLAKVYPLILEEHNVDAIGHPQITVTKLAPDNPFGFTATVAVVPKFELPGYNEIAATQNKEKPTTDVTDEDLENQIKDILRQKIAYERLQQKATAQSEESEETDDTKDVGDATELPTPESEAKKEAAADGDAEKDMTPSDDELPELTDEYVKTLGQPGQFESVEDFKNKLREHLQIEKEREVNQTHRAKITDAIVDATDINVPQVLIDAEIQQMFAQMQQDLDRSNLKMEDYLGHIKKTQEELAEEWKPAAEKRAKLQLILNKIAETENIEPNKGTVDEQVDQLKQQYPDADEERVRTYVESILKNDAVMRKLEEAK